MKRSHDPIVSAQVLMKPSSGTKPRDADLTTARIHAIRPSDGVLAEAAEALERAGFEIGTLVGLSFAITAKQSVFDSFFGISGAGRNPGEIPLGRVPVRLRQRIAAITFPPPPDFGPRSF